MKINRRPDSGLPGPGLSLAEGAGQLHRERRQGKTAIDQEQAVMVALREYEICRGLFHGFDYSKWKNGKGDEQLSLLNWAQEHILLQEDGKQRLLQTVTRLSQSLCTGCAQ